jgi:predicted amidohydrolase YtcJ
MWVNSVVLDRLGLDRMDSRVEGGEIEVDDFGRPTGILKENAAGLVVRQSSEEDRVQAIRAVRLASERLISLGLTSIHTIEDQRDADVLNKAIEDGDVGLNLVRLREINHIDDLEALSPSPQAACVKIYADGALGSQTASMLEPYCGQPENLGIEVTATKELHQLVSRAVGKGFSVAVHAIGDRANMEVLDVYEQVRREIPQADVVLRVEHAQILRGEDIPRFGRARVVASMQPIHIVADMRVAEQYWGSRCRYAYAWKSILRAGGTLAFGSDAPIEDPNPLKGIHAAVTRRDPAEPRSAGWYADERLTIAEAIDCYTRGAAQAGAGTPTPGRIEAGARGDLTILDNNILASGDPDTILDTRVDMTVVGGKVHTSR